MDFVISKGDSQLEGDSYKQEISRIIKYFLAALTTPNEQMWVNLSPYEANRIIPDDFGKTEMGRDLLAQDYMLKQLTASLMNPQEGLGKKFWDQVYSRAQKKFGTTDIPMETFNKIWIVPQIAHIYEHDQGALIVNSKLKVMLEEDYFALEANRNSTKHGLGNPGQKDIDVTTEFASQLIKDVLIPAIEKEVNEGKMFANLRQIYNSVILATWYKHRLQETLLGQIYVDQGKTQGIEIKKKSGIQEIYNNYVLAFEQGVFNFMKEDYDIKTQQIIPRKYFSGGVKIGEFSEEAMDSHQKREDAIRKFDGESFDKIVVQIRNAILIREKLERALDYLALKGPGDESNEAILKNWVRHDIQELYGRAFDIQEADFDNFFEFLTRSFYELCQSHVITDPKIRRAYIWRFCLPMAYYLMQYKHKNNLSTLRVGASGPPGVGKTNFSITMSKILDFLSKKQAMSFSIDDLFYPAEEMKKKTDVPFGMGSHDIDLGVQILKDLGNSSENTIVEIPVFDKKGRDRSSEIRKISGKVDYVIFEGFRIGITQQGYGVLAEQLDLIIALDVDIYKTQQWRREQGWEHRENYFEGDYEEFLKYFGGYWDNAKAQVIRLMPEVLENADIVISVTGQHEWKSLRNNTQLSTDAKGDDELVLYPPTTAEGRNIDVCQLLGSKIVNDIIEKGGGVLRSSATKLKVINVGIGAVGVESIDLKQSLENELGQEVDMSAVDLPTALPDGWISFSDEEILDVFRKWYKKESSEAVYAINTDSIFEVFLMIKDGAESDAGISQIVAGYYNKVGKRAYRRIAVPPQAKFKRLGKVEHIDKYRGGVLFNSLIHKMFDVDELKKISKKLNAQEEALEMEVSLRNPEDEGEIRGKIVAQKDPMTKLLGEHNIDLIKTDNLSETGIRDVDLLTVNNVSIHMTDEEEKRFLTDLGKVLKEGGVIEVKNALLLEEQKRPDNVIGISIYQKIGGVLIYRGSAISTNYYEKESYGGDLVLGEELESIFPRYQNRIRVQFSEISHPLTVTHRISDPFDEIEDTFFRNLGRNRQVFIQMINVSPPEVSRTSGVRLTYGKEHVDDNIHLEAYDMVQNRNLTIENIADNLIVRKPNIIVLSIPVGSIENTDRLYRLLQPHVGELWNPLIFIAGATTKVMTNHLLEGPFQGMVAIKDHVKNVRPSLISFAKGFLPLKEIPNLVVRVGQGEYFYSDTEEMRTLRRILNGEDVASSRAAMSNFSDDDAMTPNPGKTEEALLNQNGGIDLYATFENLDIDRQADRFNMPHIDPAIFDEYKDAKGFSPVIIHVESGLNMMQLIPK